MMEGWEEAEGLEPSHPLPLAEASATLHTDESRGGKELFAKMPSFRPTSAPCAQSHWKGR